MEMAIGKQISRYRKELGMTQEALAQHMGVTNQAVSKWETDQSCPDIQMLPKLADLFGITLDALFGRETAGPVIGDLPWQDDGTLRAVLYIGRKLQKNTPLNSLGREKSLVEFHYEGPALNVSSEFSVVCNNCVINGSVHAADSVSCGNVSGSVHAGDGVQCGGVGGNVAAGDGVQCGGVGGNVQAGDAVTCGEVGGSVRAGDSIYCTVIYGDAHANDGIHLRK